MSNDPVGSAGAGRDGSRLRELAREGAEERHVNALCGWPNDGHAQSDDGRKGFLTCPHPDCVLVRLAVPDPLASDTGQGEQPRSLSVAIDALTRVREEFNKPGYMSSNLSFVRALDPVIEQFEAVERELASSAPLASSSAPQGENKQDETTKI